MDDRIMVKVNASDHCIGFRTVSRERKSPHTFYILPHELLRLRQTGYLIVSDLQCFAELRRGTGDRATITFWWLSEGCNGSISGWKQTVMLPLNRLLDFAERIGEGDAKEWKLLSLKETFSPKLVFVDEGNLKQAVANATIRRKLARFLSRSFHYRGATEIRLFDDFLPYSFFFREMLGEQVGMCGGVILHGQDNLKKSEYSIHT